ncbi:transposable element Tcb2 transposase [Trichonephila clavipes]|nr:transposable element Tcb2 transposase [Trichonephila clavipes]
MQRDFVLRITVGGRLLSCSVEYNQILFECAESFTKGELSETYHYAVFEDIMSSCRSLTEGEIIGMMEAGWSDRRVDRQLGRSDCVVRRFGDKWIREMSFTRKPGSGRPTQTSHLENRHIVRNARVHPTVSSTAIQAQVAPTVETLVNSRTIRRRLTEGHYGSRRPLCVLPLTPTNRHLCLKWCCTRGNWTAALWNQVVFSDELSYNLSIDDNRVRVWSPHGEHLNPDFALQRHTTPTDGVMVWGSIAYNSRSPRVLMRGTMTAQWYFHATMQPHVLPLM